MEGLEELEQVCGKVSKGCSVGVTLSSLLLRRHRVLPSAMMQQLRFDIVVHGLPKNNRTGGA